MVPYPDLKLQQSVDQVQPPCLIPSLPSQGQMESVHKHILKLCCAVHPFKLSDGGHMIKHLLKNLLQAQNNQHSLFFRSP